VVISESVGVNLTDLAGVWMSSLTGVSAAARVRIVSAGNFALSLEPQAGYRFEYVVPDEALSGAGSRIIAHSVAAALLAEAAIGDHFRAATGAQISLPFAGSFSGQHGEVPFGEGQRGVLPYLVARVAYRMPWGARGFWRLQLQFAVGIGIPGAVPLEFGAGVAAGLDR
jgi:hypothetical protein